MPLATSPKASRGATEYILAAADQLADWGTFGPKLRAMLMLLALGTANSRCCLP